MDYMPLNTVDLMKVMSDHDLGGNPSKPSEG